MNWYKLTRMKQIELTHMSTYNMVDDIFWYIFILVTTHCHVDV